MVAVAVDTSQADPELKMWIRKAMPISVTVVVAVVLWSVFYPAIMSADSLEQYGQAKSLQIDDWHPPIMAAALATIFRLGGDIGTLMLLQCIAGLLGLRAFLDAQLAWSWERRKSPENRAWLATGLTLAMLIPVTPFGYYLMTFWKDSWLAITLLWIGAISIHLHGAVRRSGRLRFFGGFALLCMLMAFAVSLRHNAIVLLPVFWIIARIVLRRRRVRWASAVALIPVAVFFLGQRSIDFLFDVKHVCGANQVKALDLVGIVVLNPESRASLDYIDGNLSADFRKRYRFGDIGPVAWETPPILNRDVIDVRNRMPENPELDREYRRAVRSFPMTLVEVKLRAFALLLDWSTTHYWVHWYNNGLDPNHHGVRPAGPLRGARAWLFGAAERVAGHRTLRWISGVHLIWFAASAVGAIVWLIRTRGGPRPMHALRITLFLLPPAYYSSYLLGTVAPDFRYMYPATLFVQAQIASAFVAWWFERDGADRKVAISALRGCV
ncbi:MAG: hypothetical protein O7F76_01010 [Planctomycetota bacterium]|nr:hypothetical protein [Planctomycetota bacterium]